MNWRSRWGEAVALFHRSYSYFWVDLLIGVGLAGILYGFLQLAGEWTAPRRTVEIDLSPWALPRYTFYSLTRGLIAYCLSLLFTIAYGYWAAKDRVAERVLIPLLDILQSIPVLGFLPGVVLALVALFQESNIGLELAAILMIFTGQAWNMTFSFYHSVRSVPNDQQEVATTYRFSWWERFRWVELPYSTMGLVWNSMMSMAGGWFFLMIIETFTLEDQDFTLPGLGSYMNVATRQANVGAMLWAILAMVLMIVLLDQFLWRPVVVWAEKFRVEEGGFYVAQTSWFLSWLRRSRAVNWLSESLSRLQGKFENRKPAPQPRPVDPTQPIGWAARLSSVFFIVLLLGLAYGAWQLVGFLIDVPIARWGELLTFALLTLGRVLLAIAIGSLWAIPVGLVIGLTPALSRRLQPIVQIVASFPAPMLYLPMVVGMTALRISLDWGSVLLMLLGTQWYILFNVVAGSMAIPADLREMARSFGIPLWQRLWNLYLPAVFPFLVTGWVTAAGGAWNASIVSEYVSFDQEVVQTWHLQEALTADPATRIENKKVILQARGLGGFISDVAGEKDKRPLLAASVLVMSAVVVLFNRTVWRYCYRVAEKRFSLNK
jgi:NitT/TauT family transport system permease protein